ncbi:dpy30-related [Anaeramoeba flamelloides]|uniref:Dpy30-related n=1 Tax=Anaeramoeba flamelloides TaxID=1746091 RepID=A0AAV7YL49_9EUKA|nr:dpy30-related [Anaeramoeba flamelloides]
MFLTQINGKKKTNYDPNILHFLNDRVVIGLDNIESSVSKSVSWTRKLFNEPELAEEEIYDSTCTNLLNLVNFLCPTYHNFVASVKTPTSALKENYSEICKVLISLGYPEEKLPQTNKIIQNNKIDKRLISQMILWLKAFYEKNGIKKQNKSHVRMFYVYRECEEKVMVNKTLEEKEIDHFFTRQENIQTFEINPSIQKQNQKHFGKIKNLFWGYQPNKNKNQKRFSSSSLSREIRFLDKTSKREGSLLKKNIDLSLTMKKNKMNNHNKGQDNINNQTNQNFNTKETGSDQDDFQTNERKREKENAKNDKYDQNQLNGSQNQNNKTNTNTCSLTTSISSNSVSSMSDSSDDESSTFSASSFSEITIVEKIINANNSIDLKDIVFFDILSNKEKEGIKNFQEEKEEIEEIEEEEKKKKEEEKKYQNLTKKEKTKNKKKKGMVKSRTAMNLNRGRARKRSKNSNERKRNKSSSRMKVKKTKKVNLAFLDLDDDIILRKRSRKNSIISRVGNENENGNNNNKDQEMGKKTEKEKVEEKEKKKKKKKEQDKKKKKKKKKKKT